jgi:hypothetical protein
MKMAGEVRPLKKPFGDHVNRPNEKLRNSVPVNPESESRLRVSAPKRGQSRNRVSKSTKNPVYQNMGRFGTDPYKNRFVA